MTHVDDLELGMGDHHAVNALLAIVIGDKAEDTFRQAMLMSKGSLAIFFR